MSHRSIVIIAAGIALLAGVVLGTIWDWFNWHPMDAVVLSVLALPLVAIGIVLVLVLRRGKRSVVAWTVLGLAVGLLVGQVAGPGRPALVGSDGALAMTVDQPVAAEGTGDAFCEWTDANELQVSGDSNLRLDLLPAIPGAPPDVDQRAFVSLSVTVGDRWRDGPVARSDNVDLWLMVGGVQAGAQEVRMVASDASTLEIDWTREGGAVRFAGLVDETTGEPVDPPLAGLAGTITWTCGEQLTWVPTVR